MKVAVAVNRSIFCQTVLFNVSQNNACDGSINNPFHILYTVVCIISYSSFSRHDDPMKANVFYIIGSFMSWLMQLVKFKDLNIIDNREVRSLQHQTGSCKLGR